MTDAAELEQAWLNAEGKVSDLQTEKEKLAIELERLSKSPWITEEGFRDAKDLLDMGRVGRSLMERIEDVRRTPGYEHWMPADDPAEIVCDLLNDLADEQTARRSSEAKLTALVEALEEVLPFAEDRGLAGINGVSRERAVEQGRQALAHHSAPVGEARKLPEPDSGGPEPQCGYCARRFWTRQELAEHVYQSHGGSKPKPAPPSTPTSAPVEDVGGPRASGVSPTSAAIHALWFAEGIVSSSTWSDADKQATRDRFRQVEAELLRLSALIQPQGEERSDPLDLAAADDNHQPSILHPFNGLAGAPLELSSEAPAHSEIEPDDCTRNASRSPHQQSSGGREVGRRDEVFAGGPERGERCPGPRPHGETPDEVADAALSDGSPSSSLSAALAADDNRKLVETYDAGLLNDFGGGNVAWWQDYIRAELGRAHDHYTAQMPADDNHKALVEVVEAARDLVMKPGGLVNRGVGVGLVVVEKADKSDPHYRLCTAFEKLDALAVARPHQQAASAAAINKKAPAHD